METLHPSPLMSDGSEYISMHEMVPRNAWHDRFPYTYVYVHDVSICNQIIKRLDEEIMVMDNVARFERRV